MCYEIVGRSIRNERIRSSNTRIGSKGKRPSSNMRIEHGTRRSLAVRVALSPFHRSEEFITITAATANANASCPCERIRDWKLILETCQCSRRLLPSGNAGAVTCRQICPLLRSHSTLFSLLFRFVSCVATPAKAPLYR